MPAGSPWDERDAQVYLLVPTGTPAHIRNTLGKSCACLRESQSPWHQNKLEESVGRHRWHCRQALCLEIELGRALSTDDDSVEKADLLFQPVTFHKHFLFVEAAEPHQIKPSTNLLESPPQTFVSSVYTHPITAVWVCPRTFIPLCLSTSTLEQPHKYSRQ